MWEFEVSAINILPVSGRISFDCPVHSPRIQASPWEEGSSIADEAILSGARASVSIIKDETGELKDLELKELLKVMGQVEYYEGLKVPAADFSCRVSFMKKPNRLYLDWYLPKQAFAEVLSDTRAFVCSHQSVAVRIFISKLLFRSSTGSGPFPTRDEFFEGGLPALLRGASISFCFGAVGGADA